MTRATPRAPPSTGSMTTATAPPSKARFSSNTTSGPSRASARPSPGHAAAAPRARDVSLEARARAEGEERRGDGDAHAAAGVGGFVLREQAVRAQRDRPGGGEHATALATRHRRVGRRDVGVQRRGRSGGDPRGARGRSARRRRSTQPYALFRSTSTSWTPTTVNVGMAAVARRVHLIARRDEDGAPVRRRVVLKRAARARSGGRRRRLRKSRSAPAASASAASASASMPPARGRHGAAATTRERAGRAPRPGPGRRIARRRRDREEDEGNRWEGEPSARPRGRGGEHAPPRVAATWRLRRRLPWLKSEAGARRPPRRPRRPSRRSAPARSAAPFWNTAEARRGRRYDGPPSIARATLFSTAVSDGRGSKPRRRGDAGGRNGAARRETAPHSASNAARSATTSVGCDVRHARRPVSCASFSYKTVSSPPVSAWTACTRARRRPTPPRRSQSAGFAPPRAVRGARRPTAAARHERAGQVAPAVLAIAGAHGRRPRTRRRRRSLTQSATSRPSTSTTRPSTFDAQEALAPGLPSGSEHPRVDRRRRGGGVGAGERACALDTPVVVRAVDAQQPDPGAAESASGFLAEESSAARFEGRRRRAEHAAAASHLARSAGEGDTEQRGARPARGWRF